MYIITFEYHRVVQITPFLIQNIRVIFISQGHFSISFYFIFFFTNKKKTFLVFLSSYISTISLAIYFYFILHFLSMHFFFFFMRKFLLLTALNDRKLYSILETINISYKSFKGFFYFKKKQNYLYFIFKKFSILYKRKLQKS